MNRSRIVLPPLLALLALALSAALAVAAVPRQQEPLYVPFPRAFPVGDAPTAAMSGSFGIETGGWERDLLLGYANGNRVDIVYADRDRPGGLHRFGRLWAPTGPSFFTGDEEKFLILSPSTGRAAYYYFDIYHGRLRSKTILRVAPEPVAAVVENFTILPEGWDYPELAIVDRRTGRVRILSRDTPYHHPDEPFRPVASILLGPEPTDAVAPECCGPAMFVTTAGDNRLTLVSEPLGGQFLSRRSFRTGRRPVAVDTAADTSGRYGHELVAVANRNSDNVTVLRGSGGPTTSFRVVGTYPVGDEPVAVAALDIDHREGPDVAVANAGSDEVTILLNNGHGGLRRGVAYPVGDRPVALLPFQFDHSFEPDLVVVNRGSDDLSVLVRHVDGDCRGREAQRLVGTDGPDHLTGWGDGPNQTKGRGGDDRVDGGYGGDCLSGEGGDDIIRGGTQGDLLEGGPGNDKLRGEGILPYSRPGNDTILPGPGEDRVESGGGADHIQADDHELDRIDCGSGQDIAVIDRIDKAWHCERVRIE